MTRKDYIIIADALAASERNGTNHITEIVTALGKDNPRFNAETFYEYLRKASKVGSK